VLAKTRKEGGDDEKKEKKILRNEEKKMEKKASCSLKEDESIGSAVLGRRWAWGGGLWNGELL